MQDQLVKVPDHPRSVAYLPLAHIAERVLGIYCPSATRATSRSARSPINSCPRSSRCVRAASSACPGCGSARRRPGGEARGTAEEQSAAMEQARKTALEAYLLRSDGKDVPAELAEVLEQLDTRVMRPVRAAIGLDECHRAFSGAAPIPTRVLEFWRVCPCRCTRCGD